MKKEIIDQKIVEGVELTAEEKDILQGYPRAMMSLMGSLLISIGGLVFYAYTLIDAFLHENFVTQNQFISSLISITVFLLALIYCFYLFWNRKKSFPNAYLSLILLNIGFIALISWLLGSPPKKELLDMHVGMTIVYLFLGMYAKYSIRGEDTFSN